MKSNSIYCGSCAIEKYTGATNIRIYSCMLLLCMWYSFRLFLPYSCCTYTTHVYIVYCCSEAVEHFLQGLNMQRRGEGPRGEKSAMSDSIWSTLRMTLSLMGRPDLYKTCEQRNLDLLNKEFNIS